MAYIWTLEQWPDFEWDAQALLAPISTLAVTRGRLQAAFEQLGLDDAAHLEVRALTDSAVHTGLIEGYSLPPASVRSSVVRRLGLESAGLPPASRAIDGLVSMLHDATHNHDAPMTEERLFGWHAALFPTGYSDLQRIRVAGWRQTAITVQSGLLDNARIHFEGPPPERVPKEMTRFLAWWNDSDALEGVIRAGLAHLWFETIHPFDDGNGRIGRALADMALARADGTQRQLYSLSQQIQLERADYYRSLKVAQSGSLEVTPWLQWFIDCIGCAVRRSHEQLDVALARATLRRCVAEEALNPRQLKVMYKLIEAEPEGFEGGLNNKKYRSMTRASKATVTRDLAELVRRGLLLQTDAGGRSTRYVLNPVLLRGE